MLNKQFDIFNNKDFNIFVAETKDVIGAAIEKFWEQNVALSLFALNNFKEYREEKLILDTDFFSSMIKVDKHTPVFVRLSKECIECLFDNVLELSPDFSLTRMTGLETSILNNFCEFLYKRLKEILVPAKDLKITEDSEKYINLLFYAQLEDNECFKFMISIPYDRVKFQDVKKKISFSDDDFLTSPTFVKLKAGTTRVTLEELENLSVSDIVVLESSDKSKLTLVSGGFEKVFEVKTDPAMVLKIAGGTGDDAEDDDDDDDDEVTMEKNLWDDIEIEVNAEFEKVKMTIGELKQITQGQVVDLGSVFKNEISLFVEDKRVAKGELIVINDRYAVKLNEVMSKTQNVDAPPMAEAPAPQGAPMPQQPRPQGAPPPQARPQGAPMPPPRPAGAPPPPPRPAGAPPPPPRPQGAPPPRPAGAPPPRPAGAPPPRPAGAPPPRPQGAPPPRPAGAPPPPRPQGAPPPPRPQGQDEDFDYSDFEK